MASSEALAVGRGTSSVEVHRCMQDGVQLQRPVPQRALQGLTCRAVLVFSRTRLCAAAFSIQVRSTTNGRHRVRPPLLEAWPCASDRARPLCTTAASVASPEKGSGRPTRPMR
eukprot:366522-Chlamydomonas_euryale.AAC.30